MYLFVCEQKMQRTLTNAIYRRIARRGFSFVYVEFFGMEINDKNIISFINKYT